MGVVIASPGGVVPPVPDPTPIEPEPAPPPNPDTEPVEPYLVVLTSNTSP